MTGESDEITARLPFPGPPPEKTPLQWECRACGEQFYSYPGRGHDAHAPGCTGTTCGTGCPIECGPVEPCKPPPLTQSQQQEDMDRVRLAFDMAGVRAYAEVDALRARLSEVMADRNDADALNELRESALSASRRELDALAETLATARGSRFDLHAHLARQREWSDRTFGPQRLEGVIDHIAKELDELRREPNDLEEWIDATILSLDGAGRTGATPQQIVAALVAKQTKNEARTWPDWRTAEPGKAIEHVRDTAPDSDLTAARGEIARLREACVGENVLGYKLCRLCDGAESPADPGDIRHLSWCALAAKGGA